MEISVLLTCHDDDDDLFSPNSTVLSLNRRRYYILLVPSLRFSLASILCIMASSVFYKFKSQKDESRVTFDGTAISVFDLKREIILANNLGKANDFDLHVFDVSTNQGTFTAPALQYEFDIHYSFRIQG